MQSVYKIGLEIVARNSTGPAFRYIMRDLLGMGKQTDLLVGKWSRLRVAAIGVGTALAGVAVLRGMMKMVELSDKLYRNELRLRQMGMSTPASRSVTQTALRAQMRYPTVTASDSEAVATKLFTTFNSPKRVKAALGPSVAAEAVLENWHRGGPAALADLIKSIEISGGAFKRINGKEVFSVSKFKDSLNLFMRAMNIGGSLMTTAQIYQATRMAGPGASLQTLKAYVDTMAEVVQQMKSRGGRGMNMVYKELMGGMTGRTYLDNLMQLGIVKPGGVQWYQGSSMGNIKPGALVGQSVLNKQGLFAWVSKSLIPDLVKHGYTTLQQQIGILYRIFGSATAQALVQNMIQNKPAYERTAAMIDRSPGVRGILSSQLKGEQASMKALRHAWDSFVEVAGKPLIDPVVRMLHDLTRAVIGIESWAIAHPQLMAKIGKWLGLLGVALLGLGTGAVMLAIVSLAGTGGWIFGIGAALVYLAMSSKTVRGNLDAVASRLEEFGGILTKMFSWLPSFPKSPSLPISPSHPVIMPWSLPRGSHFYYSSGNSPLGNVPGLHATNRAAAAWLHGVNPTWHAAVPAPRAGHGGQEAPVPVLVVNGKDIAHGVTRHQAAGLQRNPSGPVGHNLRQGYIQPAYPTPGL